MPLYEYACQECHQDFELLMRTGESPECPHCGSQRLQKLLSTVVAHSAGGSTLPVCNGPEEAGCGFSQCGGGACGFAP